MSAELQPANDDASHSARPQFHELFREQYDFVWRSARFLGVREATLDDVAQEVFMVVHRRLDTFEPGTSLRSWLFTIAQRTASNHRRGERRADRKKQALSETSPADADSGDSTDARMLVHGFLDTLDEERRRLFIMSELEGFTGPELAEALDAKLNTTYTRVKALRRDFAAYCRADGAAAHALASAREQCAPAAARQRCWAALLVSIEGLGGGAATLVSGSSVPAASAGHGGAAAGATAKAGATHLAVGAATKTATGLGVKLALGAAIVAGTAGVVATQRDPAPTPDATAGVAPSVHASAEAPTPVLAGTGTTSDEMATTDSGTGDTAPSREAAPEPETRTRPAAPKPTTAEVRFLQRARAALAAGDLAAAQAELDRLDLVQPKGTLGLTRAGLRFELLCAKGKTAEAERLAARIVRRHPRSSAAQAMQKGCQP